MGLAHLISFFIYWVVARYLSATKAKSKKRVNPQTKEALTIPAKKVPKFRAGKKLREAVR